MTEGRTAVFPAWNATRRTCGLRAATFARMAASCSSVTEGAGGRDEFGVEVLRRPERLEGVAAEDDEGSGVLHCGKGDEPLEGGEVCEGEAGGGCCEGPSLVEELG